MVDEKFQEFGIKHWEVSAKTGENIEKMFQEACGILLDLPPEAHLTPIEIQQSKVLIPTDIPQEK
jgi:hypothetical protein